MQQCDKNTGQRFNLSLEKKTMNPIINELPEELKFKVGDVIRKINAGAYDTKMIVVRIEKDCYLCDNIGKYSSSMVSIAEQDNYELVKEPESKVTRNIALLKDMEKTIEERFGLCKHCLCDTDRYCHSDCHIYSKYCGAVEQKRIDIDKAKQAFMTSCGWLKTTHSWFDAVFDEFIKELEK